MRTAVQCLSVAAGSAAVAVALAASRASNPLDAPLARPLAVSFDAFWPLYLEQHSRPLTRVLHAVGTLLGLVDTLHTSGIRAICALVTAASIGACISVASAHLATGAAEALTLITCLLVVSRCMVGSASAVLRPLCIGYSFAWIAHFFVEENRPATFVYPAYSLIGDFKLLALVTLSLMGVHSPALGPQVI